ncbi:MAG: cytochrome ubiquinol oxidase subunit I [Neisseriaceae bacterium]
MDTLVDLSRVQFGMTAMFHFLFVPLTLGITWLLVIMESIYVITGNQIYKDMTKFWGKLFGINFAIGVTTGLTMEFQFGTNWAYYSHYVGDIFGAPLAIEGLMAFFLESTFVGLFFFAWDRLSKKQHLLVTILVAIGSNLSAFWILVANGWMMHPVGTTYNPATHRMELENFWSVLTNPFAWYKFFHTVSAGYVAASLFILGISAFYLLKKRDLLFARSSFKVAAIFGFFASIAVILFGDNSGIQVYKYQPSKLAAIEGVWNTEKAPVGWSLIAWPDEQKRENLFDIKIPYAASLIIMHNFTDNLKGVNNIIADNKEKIIMGQKGLSLLNQIEANPNNGSLLEKLKQYSPYLGYGLLLKKYTNNVNNATDDMIQKASEDTVPNVLPLYFTFRIMVALGISFLVMFAFAFYYVTRSTILIENRRWLLKWAVYWIPMPWIAILSGWFVAEYGRQPWTIFEILPTYLSASSLSVSEVTLSLTGFAVIYSILAVIEIWLMTKYAKLGPSSLGTGKYHFEQISK